MTKKVEQKMTKKVEQKINRQLTNRVKRWLYALESGKYKQARGVLRNKKTKGFCCLGVACDVYKETTGKGSWESSYDSENKMVFKIGDARAVTSPPAIVRDFFGFSACDISYDLVNDLINKNDNLKMKFKTIAKYIRENKDKLFREKLGKI